MALLQVLSLAVDATMYGMMQYAKINYNLKHITAILHGDICNGAG